MGFLCVKVLFLCVLFIVCTKATTPFIKSFGPGRYRTLREDYNGTVCSINVKDTDIGDTIKVSPADDFTRNHFNIVPDVGTGNFLVNVTIKELLDRETLAGNVKLKLEITDDQHNKINFEYTVYISDINDNRPEFFNLPYRLEKDEKPCKNGTEVYKQIKATDKDQGNNGKVRYSMAPVAQSEEAKQLYNDTFSIDSVSGNIKLTRCLDYESNNYYQFTIFAKDSGNPEMTSTAEFIIRVKDVQDMPPFFTGDPYRITIKEDKNIGSEVITVNARDGDPGVSNKVSYSITDSTCPGLFEINATSGTILISKQLDRDAPPINITGKCVLTIETQEIENSTVKNYNTTTASATVTITVDDTDDNKPKFGNHLYYATVAENTPEDVPIKLNTTIVVTDIDQGDNANMMISLKNTDNTICENFIASPSEIQGSGKVTILVKNGSILDYEKLRNITIQVFATGKVNSSFYDMATVRIAIQDKNDNSPEFNKTTFDLTVHENAENGTVVNTITATDADFSPKFKVKTYSMSGGNDRFDVNNFGVVTTKCKADELDREKQADYYMTLFAEDWDGSRSSVVLHVTLTDENDNYPKFSRPVYTSFVEENKMTNIIKLEASDRDQQKNPNSEFSFSIVNSTEPGNFSSQNLTINNSSGDISLVNPIDYEHLNNNEGEVNITVKVTDKGNKPLSTTAIVQLAVQDKNDNPPIFNQTVYKANIAENETSTLKNTKFVTQVFAHDADVTEPNNKINYFKIGGSDKFKIDATSGKISIQIDSKLNRETEPMYTISIVAMDQGSPPQSGTTTVSIDVTDVNDEKPTFGDTHQYTTSVTENTTHGQNVYTCNASDPDSDNKLVYSIIKVTAIAENGKPVSNASVKDYFGVYSGNGSVYVNEELDRETAQTITLTIQVNDTNAVLNAPQLDTATLKITLNDVNDNKPLFEPNKYNISVREDANNGSPLVTIHATDRDVNRTITYTLVDGPSPTSSFIINNKTGLLTKTGELDRETVNHVLLNVIASDNGVPSLNSTVTVNVNLLDFNDNSPVFEKISNANNMHMKENEPIGEELVDVNATDADEGPNKNITFSMDRNDYFAIDEISGKITVNKSPDRENTSLINLRIVAKDNPMNNKVQKSSFITLIVKIDDENDNSPHFAEDEYSKRIEEDKPVNSVIIQVTATDADEKGTINAEIDYEIVDTFNGKFTIEQNNGKIKINSSLIDFVNIYRLQIVAFDKGNPRLNGTTFVNINVTDKNRHPPVIGNYLPERNELKIYECAVKGTVIHTFNYTDRDHGVNAEANFTIRELQDNVTGVFNLTPDGKLEVAGKLDVNKKAKYKFGIVATDKGIPSLSSDLLKITISLTDVNDHLPSFKLPKVVWQVREDTTYTDSIGEVTAVDEDKDSLPCYTITSFKWKDSFSVSKHNGHIFNVEQLDREVTPTISFNVTVNDCSVTKSVSDACNKTFTSEIEKMRQQTNDTIEVIIDVLDTDDSPPVFKQKNLATGMHRNTQADTELEIKLRNESYISDADTPQNGYLSWTFTNEGNITVSLELQSKIKARSGLKPCDDGVKHIFCVTRNGTITNNKLFSEDLSGYFILTVKVADKGGYDTANITIYLISDSQIITMTILKDKETVSSFKDNLLRKLSEILGYSAIFDSLQDHFENGALNIQSSELRFHLVEKDSQAVLSGEKAIQLIDTHANNGEMQQLQSTYNVMRVSQQAMSEDDTDAGSKKLTFILVAVSTAEALIITIIIFIALSARNKFRRKLKAANINTPDMEMHAHEQKGAAIPGSNLYSKMNNPLLNADIDPTIQDSNIDSASIASYDDINLDENVVGDHNTVYDRMEEREVTMDMYNDDTLHSVSSEDLLSATLNMHALRKSKESLDNISDDDGGPNDTYDRPNTAAAFINEAFVEDLESTEI